MPKITTSTKIKKSLNQATAWVSTHITLSLLILTSILLTFSIIQNIRLSQKLHQLSTAYEFVAPDQDATGIQVRVISQGEGAPATGSARLGIAYTLKDNKANVIEKVGYEEPFVLNPVLVHDFPALHNLTESALLGEQFQATIPADQKYLGRLFQELPQSDFYILDVTIKDIYFR